MNHVEKVENQVRAINAFKTEFEQDEFPIESDWDSETPPPMAPLPSVRSRRLPLTVAIASVTRHTIGINFIMNFDWLIKSTTICI